MYDEIIFWLFRAFQRDFQKHFQYSIWCWKLQRAIWMFVLNFAKYWSCVTWIDCKWSWYILFQVCYLCYYSYSFYGAQQLSLDFGYIKVWLASDSSNLSSEMQSHLLNLDVFRHLDGAVRLLMLQPRKKKQSPGDLDDPELESNVSTMSSSSVLSSLSGVDIDSYDLDVLNDKTIPNSQKWLDLRLRGGKSKKGLLPFCLKVQEMKWFLVSTYLLWIVNTLSILKVNSIYSVEGCIMWMSLTVSQLSTLSNCADSWQFCRLHLIMYCLLPTGLH